MHLLTRALCVSHTLISSLLLLIALTVPSLLLAQEPQPAPQKGDEVRAAVTLVDQAAQRAHIDAWDAQASFRKGQRDVLKGLTDADAARRLATFSLMQSVQESDYQTRRVVLAQLPAPTVTVAKEEPPPQDPLESSKTQAAKAEQARLELEDALLKEAAEQDQAQKALLKRKRELAEQRVTWTNQAGPVLVEAQGALAALEASWSAFIEPLNVSIDTLPDVLTSTQRQELVDPLMAQLIMYRRELWKDTAQTRARLIEATEELGLREDAYASAEADIEELKSQPVRTSALRTQRVEVNQAALTLASARLGHTRELVAVLTDRLEVQNQHVEEISMALRRVLPVASSEARSEFYDVFHAQNWRDAADLLRDRVDGWRTRFTQRWLAANNMSDRLMNVMLWILALLPRLFLFVIASVVLRFIPALLRRILDMMLRRTTFRRNPGWAIKFYELSRVVFKPALYFWVTSTIFDYILITFPEALALWGAIEAVFVFWLVDRVARTLFYSRARREACVSSPYVFLEKPVTIHVRERDRTWGYDTMIVCKAYVNDVRFESAFITDITERVKRGFKVHNIRSPQRMALPDAA